MRKKLLILGMCVAMVFSMTACKSSSSGKTASNGELTDNSKADMQGTLYKTTVKLGQYKGLTVGESNAKATEEEIEKAVQNVLESNATDRKYEEGVLELGDTANIDFEGKINGVAFEGGTSKGYNLKLGGGGFIKGFEDGLVGKKVGETVELNLKFPDDYKNSSTGELSEHAGKDVIFTVTINYFNRSIVPELTDAFVKEYCTVYKVETVSELKEYLEKQLVLNKKLSAIWQTLLDSTEITYNKGEVAGLVEQMKNQYVQYYNAYGMKLSDYLEYAGMTEEEFDQQMDTSVRNSLKNIVIAMTVAREEGLEVTETEYREEVDPDVEAGTFDSLEEFQAMYPKQDTVDSLLYYKVLEWIADKCEVVPDTEIETTTKEPETTTAAE